MAAATPKFIVRRGGLSFHTPLTLTYLFAHSYTHSNARTQGYRGIGFVTFTSADSVEKVMAVKHWMNGHEIAIDRATPKEEPSVLKSLFARMPITNGQRRSFDNGEFGACVMFVRERQRE